MNEIITGNNSTVVVDDKDTTINNTTINKNITVIKTPKKANRTKNEIIIANQEMILKKLDMLLADNDIVTEETIQEDNVSEDNVVE